MCLIDIHLAEDRKEEAKELMIMLRDVTDRIRRNYWEFKLR
jgi:hypothetical protein